MPKSVSAQIVKYFYLARHGCQFSSKPHATGPLCSTLLCLQPGPKSHTSRLSLYKGDRSENRKAILKVMCGSVCVYNFVFHCAFTGRKANPFKRNVWCSRKSRVWHRGALPPRGPGSLPGASSFESGVCPSSDHDGILVPRPWSSRIEIYHFFIPD